MYVSVILAGENQRVWRKTYPSATLFATDLTWTAVGLTLTFTVKRPLTNRFLKVLALQNHMYEQYHGWGCPYSV
jgi:hypothetical protein